MSLHSDSASDHVDRELEQLIPLAKQGDRDARNRIAELLRPRLRNFAASRFPQAIRSRTDASEVAQDALLDIDQSLDDFRGVSAGEMKAWAFWKVRDKLSDIYGKHVLAGMRSVNRETSPSDAGMAFVHTAMSGSTPSAAAIRNEEREYLFQEIGLLPDREQEVMELLYQAELSPQDVAAALHISTEEVEKFRFKALRRIAKRAAHQRSQEAK